MTTPLRLHELLMLDGVPSKVALPGDWRAAIRAELGTVVEEDAPAPATKATKSRRPPAAGEAPKRRPRRIHTHEGVRRIVDKAYSANLFSTSVDAPHAVVPLQRLWGLLEDYFTAGGPAVKRMRRELSLGELCQGMLVALQEGFKSLICFRGGNDCSRGFGERGAEWPLFGAFVDGRMSLSDTTMRDIFIAWEDTDGGYRKTRLIPEPVVCQRTGRRYENRFDRNDVYVSRDAIARWIGHELFRPFVEFVRRRAGKALYALTQKGRAWRKLGMSFRHACTLTSAERSELLSDWKKKRAERRAKRKAAKLDRIRASRAKKNGAVQTATVAVQTLPIIPSSSSKKELPVGACGPSEADAAHAATPSKPPDGRHCGPGHPGGGKPSTKAETPGDRFAGQGKRTATVVPPGISLPTGAPGIDLRRPTTPAAPSSDFAAMLRDRFGIAPDDDVPTPAAAVEPRAVPLERRQLPAFLRWREGPAAPTKAPAPAPVPPAEPRPYRMTDTYAWGDRVTHHAFGSGQVSRVVDSNRIQVLFADGYRTLFHGQTA